MSFYNYLFYQRDQSVYTHIFRDAEYLEHIYTSLGWGRSNWESGCECVYQTTNFSHYVSLR